MDLLSGDDYSSPKADNSLALVPVGVQPPNTPLSQQNALVLFDMFTDANTPNSVNTQSANLAGQSNHLAHQIQQQQNTQSPQGGFYSNGSAPNVGSPQYEQSVYMQGAGSAWNGQIPQQQQPPSSVYGAVLTYIYAILYYKYIILFVRSNIAEFSYLGKSSLSMPHHHHVKNLLMFTINAGSLYFMFSPTSML